MPNVLDRPISVMIVVRSRGDIELANALRLKLAEAYRIEVTDVVYSASDCLRRMELRPPDVMLITEGLHDMPALELSRQVNVSRGGATATILLVEEGFPSAEYYDRAAASGARRVVSWKANRDRLVAAITDSVNVRPVGGRVPGAAAVRREDQLTVAIASAKGGVGKTFLSANLAAYLATAHPARKVALMDLNLQFSALGPLMNLPRGRTIYDLLPVMEDLKPGDIDSIVVKYPLAGNATLYVLPAPINTREVDELEGKHISSLLTNLQRQYDVAILDTTATVSDVTVTGFQHSDQVWLVCTQDVLAVAQTRRLLEYLSGDIGMARDRMRLVLNQVRPDSRITPRDIEDLFEVPLAATIPYDPRVQHFVNEGVLLTQSSPTLPSVNDVKRAIAQWGNQLVPLPKSPSAKPGQPAGVPAAGSGGRMKGR
jgi:Flp pilus assembly CpaE family ATPase